MGGGRRPSSSPRPSALAVLGVGGGFAPGLGGFVLWPLGLGLVLRCGLGWGGVRAGPVWVRLSSRLVLPPPSLSQPKNFKINKSKNFVL